jgi:Cu-Zn family superoxide dismutase
MIGAIAAGSPAMAGAAKASGTFTANPAFVPSSALPVNPTIGAEGHIHVTDANAGRTIVSLHVEGLPANRSFAAHLHRDPCSSAFGGPHYQAPTGTPAGLADPDHEVWLDFTTNAAGNAHTNVVVPFDILPGARSVVIHQEPHTGTGGAAGQRLACLDVTI